jgi:HAD superfamily hydrolase (TIGR01548 family)
MAKPLIVFDMDGVLVEVKESYRETIRATVRHFTGQDVSHEQIQELKNAGGWNNDWLLSQKLCIDRGTDVQFSTVVQVFNGFFFGDESTPGLMLRERWIAAPGLLEGWAERYDLAVFTGRLRAEAQMTLDRFCPDLPIYAVIGDDDVDNSKPAPDGLLKLREMHPTGPALYIGDTIDDARSGLAAQVPFIGIAARESQLRDQLVSTLQAHGARAVIEDINQLEAHLPHA